MTLQGIVGRQIRRTIEEMSPDERRLQTETVPSRREALVKLESLLPRFPFFETGIWNPLAARLQGGPQADSVSPNPPLAENQSKLLQGILSVEAASAELALLSEAATGEWTSEETHALRAYRKELVSRTYALEARLHEELNLLEEAISDRVDLLSGNESENEGESAVETELAEWEGRRCVVEEELASLATFREGLEELDGQGPAIWLEELAGTASDLLDLEWKYLEEDWAKSVEEIEVLAPRYVELARVQAKLVQLEIPGLPAMEALWVLRAEAELWAVTEARIEQFGQMMKTAGITDGIINLGGLTREDLTFAQEYSFRQSDYTRVHRYLTEGKTKEALELFQALEASQETRILFETIQEAEKINACTIHALTVVGAGGVARLAMPVIRGLALMGNVSSKAIPTLQFAGQVGTFTVAHRQLNGWVMEQPFFDPNLSALENATVLSREFLFNAGMFAFLGISQQVFAASEAKVLHGIAKRRGAKVSLQNYGPMTVDAEAASSLTLQGLKRSPLVKLAHTGGSFGTELVGFGAWDYLSANVRGLVQGDYNAKRIFAQTLGSRDQWEHNLVFLTALKAGGALAAPAFRPMTRSAEGFARAKYHNRLSELDRSARGCVEALEKHLERPADGLGLLESYESALRAKADFLRDLPSELTHPAALAMLDAEIQNVRELGAAIKAGVFDAAANDGGYHRPVPSIGIVADPLEQAANDATTEIPASESLTMASGAFYASADGGGRSKGPRGGRGGRGLVTRDAGSGTAGKSENGSPQRSVSRKAPPRIPTDPAALAHDMRRGSKSREIVGSLEYRDYQRLSEGIDRLNSGEAGQILRNMAKLYAEPKNALGGHGPFQDCLRLAFEKSGAEDREIALEILRPTNGALFFLLEGRVRTGAEAKIEQGAGDDRSRALGGIRGLRQEFDPIPATRYHERPWMARIGYEIEAALLDLSRAGVGPIGMGMRLLLLQRVDPVPERVEFVSFETLQPFSVLLRQGSQTPQEALVATRNELAIALWKSGWRLGDSPDADLLETAVRVVMPDGDLPIVTRANFQGRSMLIHGEMPVAAILSLVAEGALPMEVLGRLPVQRAALLDGVSLVQQQWDRILRDEQEAFGWQDVLAFDPLSLRFLAENMPAEAHLGGFSRSRDLSPLKRISVDEISPRLGRQLGDGMAMKVFADKENPHQAVFLQHCEFIEENIDARISRHREIYDSGLSYEGHRIGFEIFEVIYRPATGKVVGYVAEKIEGRTLLDLLEDVALEPEQLPLIKRQVLDQLELLHGQGYYHGDPSLENFLVEIGQDGVTAVRLIDFRLDPDLPDLRENQRLDIGAFGSNWDVYVGRFLREYDRLAENSGA